METRSVRSMFTFMRKHQPLTPVSPCLPTSLPLVCDPIPQLPLTPPDADVQSVTNGEEEAIQTVLHVLSTERDALTHLKKLYESDAVAQAGFINAVDTILKMARRRGKLIVCGVGKSGKIGEKVVATMNSVGIRSTFLHPTEALHGDLGTVGPDDTMLMITFSGRTPELLTLLPHISPSMPLIVVTAHTHPSTCPLFFSRLSQMSILLPAPIHISETQAFGLPAPTTSTTTALALTDALALALARRLHPDPRAIFHAYHPGGAIGASAASQGPPTVGSIATSVDSVPIINAGSGVVGLTAREIILAAARSPSCWVRVTSSSIIAPRRIQRLGLWKDLDCPMHRSEMSDYVIEKTDWISIPAANSIREATEWILEMRNQERGKEFLKAGTLLGVVDGENNVSSVVEIEDVVGPDEVQAWENDG